MYDSLQHSCEIDYLPPESSEIPDLYTSFQSQFEEACSPASSECPVPQNGERQGRQQEPDSATSVRGPHEQDVACQHAIDTKALVIEINGEQLEVVADHWKTCIGSGAFGAVYKGVLGEEAVAVKKLKANDVERSGFQTEIRVLSAQHHRYIVALRAFCRDPPALVYEFLSGGDLQARIKSLADLPPGALTWKERMCVAYEISMGLHFLHDHKPEAILHLDLKPANILLDEQGRCKLADVGLARFSNRSVTARGTPGFMDPHLSVTGTVSHRSDIYSLGRTLLHLFTGLVRPEQVHELFKKFSRSDQDWQEGLRAKETRGFWGWGRVRQPAELVALAMRNLDEKAGTWPRALSRKVVKIALQCASPSPSSRPKLLHVCRILEDAYEAAENFPVFRVVKKETELAGKPRAMKQRQPLRLTMMNLFLQRRWCPAVPRSNSEMGAGTAGTRERTLESDLPSLERELAEEVGNRGAPTTSKAEERNRGAAVVAGLELRRFTLRELKEATNNFSKRFLLGKTSMYLITRGVLKPSQVWGLEEGARVGNRSILVKKILPSVLEDYDEFLSTLLLLNKVRHPNVEKLLGYCLQEGQTFLVFDHYGKGTLKSVLPSLTWSQRVKVASEISAGLSYLHANDIMHKSLQPSCILISEDLTAVVSGWEEAGQVDGKASGSIMSTACMTVGLESFYYVDPSYVLTGRFSKKSDVYSLGIVLLEILSGRSCSEANLKKWAKPFLAQRKPDYAALMDPRLKASYSKDGAAKLARLIRDCMNDDPEGRPDSQIVGESIKKLQRS